MHNACREIEKMSNLCNILGFIGSEGNACKFSELEEDQTHADLLSFSHRIIVCTEQMVIA